MDLAYVSSLIEMPDDRVVVIVGCGNLLCYFYYVIAARQQIKRKTFKKIINCESLIDQTT